MVKIDAHQHFWIFDAVRDAWIGPEMATIQRDFLPEDLDPLLKEAGIGGTVAVQASPSEEETEFLLGLAGKSTFIKGVVGWIDLQSPVVGERLAYYRRFDRLKGFRHVLQGEKDRALMLKPAFKRGIAALREFGYTYDILIYPDQLGYAQELAMSYPDQVFVLDHIAKPHIREKSLVQEWQEAIRAVGRQENVFCKISGMVTEADWKQWRPDELRPYLDTVVEAFGTRRILFGSDWPVCLVAADYARVLGVVQDYFSCYSKTEVEDFFGGNAIRCYNL